MKDIEDITFMNPVDGSSNQESIQNAQGLLATVRRFMTGIEIDICEKIADMERTDCWEPLYLSKDELGTFKSLITQFYAQITNWKDNEVTDS